MTTTIPAGAKLPRPNGSGAVRGRAVQADIASEGNRATFAWAGFWIAVVAALSALDLWDDLHDGKAAWVLSIHVVFSVTALAVAGYFAFQVVRLRRRVHELSERLQLPGPDEERWRALSAAAWPAFASALHQQFTSWGLSAEEREVAILLLNGLAPPQIAALRAVDPRLVAAQAMEVYRKAGLSGRSELVAFFFADLVR